MNSVKLRVYKDKFSFSSAHFLIFDAHRAERLHGHNYRVQLTVEAGAESISKDQAFLLDFGELKEVLGEEVDRLDEMVLLPGNNPEMHFEEKDLQLHVSFRDRYYVFPRSEVILLPIVNTSVEALSELLAQRLASRFPDLDIQSLTIEVEESPGQSASFCLHR